MNNTADRKFNNTDVDEGIVKYKDDSFDDDDGGSNSNDNNQVYAANCDKALLYYIVAFATTPQTTHNLMISSA